MDPHRQHRIIPVLLALALIGGVFAAGFAAGVRHPRVPAPASAVADKAVPEELRGRIDFSPFWETWRVIDEKYVSIATTTSAQDKVWGAISGLANSLKDPYTVFLPPEDLKLFESEVTGNFEGVGMEIGIKDGTLTVVAPLKGTPAERAGIQSGDKIVKIDDAASTNMRVEEAVRRIRGERGTTVRLTILREGKREPLEIPIVRAVIDIPTIDTEIRAPHARSGEGEAGTGLRGDGVFVIRLFNFSAQSPRLFRDALRTFVASGSSRLLIDVRGNPGGFLEAAVDIASWFLPPGAVVAIEESGREEDRRIHRSRGYNVFNENIRLVVLVNGGSASASEILAGALKEHGKAAVVGAKTFGKGSVQELVPITKETSLKVTVARWLTPKGVSISEEGIVPDVIIEMTPEDVEAQRDPQLARAIELLAE